MYSPKTLTQALLIASIATNSLASFAPDRDGTHAARAILLPPKLGADAVRLGSAAVKGLVNSDIKKAANDIENLFKNSTTRGFDTQDLDARAIRLPDSSPDVADPIKTSAVRGIRNRGGRRQSRSLSDDDIRLLSLLARRVIEELD